jgi:hypothetical protein
MAAGAKGAGKSRVQVAPGTPPPSARIPVLRVLARKPGDAGPRFRAVVTLGHADELDVTGAMTAPLAHALWQLRGGPDIGNWVDAEALLDNLLAQIGEGDAAASLSVVVPKKRPATAR